MKTDCWWNESAKGGKDTASLEAPVTPAVADATIEPSINEMFHFLLQSKLTRLLVHTCVSQASLSNVHH